MRFYVHEMNCQALIIQIVLVYPQPKLVAHGRLNQIDVTLLDGSLLKLPEKNDISSHLQLVRLLVHI